MNLLTYLLFIIGSSTVYGRDCQEGRGETYRGKISESVGKKQCFPWNSNAAARHSYSPADYPNSGLDNNYCRNPDSWPPGPWCVIRDHQSSFRQQCHIPLCPDTTTTPTPTIGCPAGMEYLKKGSPCLNTCTDQKAADNCNKTNEAGCVCLVGMFWMGNHCVPISECRCLADNGNKYQVGDSWLSDDCKTKYTCSKGFIILEENYRCPDCKECDGNGQCLPPKTCYGVGDVHYKTFDGIAYIHYQGICEVVLSKSKAGVGNHFEVRGVAENRGNPRVAWLKAVYILLYYKGQIIIICFRKYSVMQINGVPFTPPLTLNLDGGESADISITSGYIMTLQTTFCLRVTYDGNHLAQISVNGNYFGKVCGICGNANMDPEDDWETKDGKNVKNSPNRYSLIGDSYLVDDPISSGLPDQCNTTDPEICMVTDIKCCEDLKSITFINEDGSSLSMDDIYIIESSRYDYIENCKYDLCFVDDPTDACCSAAESLVQDLENLDYVVDPAGWREMLDCEIVCPPGTKYLPNGSLCFNTCTDLNAADNCEEGTGPVCDCPDGMVWMCDRCVYISECGCWAENGNIYQLGEMWFSDNCTVKYTCAKGLLIVSEPFDCPEGRICNDSGVCVPPGTSQESCCPPPGESCCVCCKAMKIQHQYCSDFNCLETFKVCEGGKCHCEVVKTLPA